MKFFLIFYGLPRFLLLFCLCYLCTARVRKVNGIVADYDVDKTYWSFFINGEMAMTGVDGTEIEDGAIYSFKVVKE